MDRDNISLNLATNINEQHRLWVVVVVVVSFINFNWAICYFLKHYPLCYSCGNVHVLASTALVVITSLLCIPRECLEQNRINWLHISFYSLNFRKTYKIAHSKRVQIEEKNDSVYLILVSIKQNMYKYSSNPSVSSIRWKLMSDFLKQ